MIPVKVKGSKAIHLTAERFSTDAWRHVPGFTFCGMEPGPLAPIHGDLCQSCAAWYEQILVLCKGLKDEPRR